MRVVLYIRVSTDEQANEGYSIRAQRNQLVDYCRVNDYEVVGTYIDDGYSAKDTKRPQLQEMLEAAKRGEFDAIVVYKLDRITRSAKDLYDLLEHFQKFGIDFISKQEKFDTTSAMGRLMIGVLAVLAQFERELIAERVRLGMEQKVKEGKKPGGRYPYGYDSKGNLIEEEAEDIRLVRNLYMSGLSYQGVAAQMFRDNKYRRGKEWTAGTVALTLENPIYAGIIRFGSKLPNGKYPQRKRDQRVKVIDVTGDHKPIWTMQEYEEHLARMRRRTSGGFSRQMDYWFNGVLRCGRCGASMYGRLTTKRSRKDGSTIRSAYYWCSRRKANKGCDMPMFRQSHVEYLVMEHIAKLRVPTEEMAKEANDLKKEKVERKKEAAKHRRDLDKIRARIKKWQYAFAEELIDENDFRQRMREDKDEEEKVIAKLSVAEDVERLPATEGLLQLADLWPELDDLDKQEAVSSIFDRITLLTNETNVKGVKNAFFPAEVEVKYL